LTTTNISF